jgi:hypothetical protein
MIIPIKHSQRTEVIMVRSRQQFIDQIKSEGIGKSPNQSNNRSSISLIIQSW